MELQHRFDGRCCRWCIGAGGRVCGVMPKVLVDREQAHIGLTDLHVVEDMHQRKAVMMEQADAFIALPGGTGIWKSYLRCGPGARLVSIIKPLAC